MEKILKKVYNSPALRTLLTVVSHLAVVLTAAGYLLLLASCLAEPMRALKLIAIAALPFCLVTLLRSRLNAPRPYELYGFYEKAPKSRSGRSFPSRHVFSAFIIGCVALPVYPVMGGVILLLGALLAAARVLLGIHFPRDVIAGALIGAVCALLGIIILRPF